MAVPLTHWSFDTMTKVTQMVIWATENLTCQEKVQAR